MNTLRNYNCKNEELLAVCEFAATRFVSDMADFAKYSPKFNEQYLNDFQIQIAQAREIVFPVEQTKELKIVTTRMYANLDKLADLLDRLNGYISLAKTLIPVSAKDFGTTVLKQKIRKRNTEGVLNDIVPLIHNIEKYKQSLTAQGLTQEMTDMFDTLNENIKADNIRQFEITSDRRRLTEANITMFNALYGQLIEICEIGKILYKKSDPDKLRDYQFTELLKKTRVEHR